MRLGSFQTLLELVLHEGWIARDISYAFHRQRDDKRFATYEINIYIASIPRLIELNIIKSCKTLSMTHLLIQKIYIKSNVKLKINQWICFLKKIIRNFVLWNGEMEKLFTKLKRLVRE